MLSYLKYKKYNDRKAKAAPLKINDNCYILSPKADNQSTKFAFQDCIWTGPYIVIKILSNNNYTIRNLGTRYTQTLHRIRIRPCVPDRRLPDITVRSNDYLPNPDLKVSHNEWYAVSWEMDFGKQIDENEISKGTETNQQVVTQEKTQMTWRRRHRTSQILLQTWEILACNSCLPALTELDVLSSPETAALPTGDALTELGADATSLPLCRRLSFSPA